MVEVAISKVRLKRPAVWNYAQEPALVTCPQCRDASWLVDEKADAFRRNFDLETTVKAICNAEVEFGGAGSIKVKDLPKQLTTASKNEEAEKKRKAHYSITGEQPGFAGPHSTQQGSAGEQPGGGPLDFTPTCIKFKKAACRWSLFTNGREVYDRQKQLETEQAQRKQRKQPESRAEILRLRQEEADNVRKALARSLEARYFGQPPIDLEAEYESTPGAPSSTDLPPVGASSSSSAPAAAQPQMNDIEMEILDDSQQTIAADEHSALQELDDPNSQGP